MRFKQSIWLVAIFSLVVLWGVSSIPHTAAQEQGTVNLLANPGFEGGHYNQDGIAEITVPNSWRMHYVDGVTFSDAYDGLTARRPETVVWNSVGGVPAGEEGFWRDGAYTLKIFKSWAPMYAAISQDVSGLEVGKSYRLIIPVYTDIYDWDDGKVAPWDPTHGQVRLGVSSVGAPWRDAGAIAYSGWFAATFFAYDFYVYDFTATEANMTVWAEVKGTYPHGNNGFFIDGVAMYGLDGAATSTDTTTTSSSPVTSAQPAGPTVTPFPTPTPRPDGAIVHKVNSGETLWVIAIQYSSATGLTAQDMLNQIRELNSGSDLLSVGEELIIAPAGTQSVAAVISTDSEAETTTGGTDATTETTDSATEEITSETETTTVAETAVTEATPEPVAIAANLPGSVCVSAFNDENGDGVRDASEVLLSDGIITISRPSGTVATYVSDGLNEPYCFEELDPDTYQVLFSQPDSYQPTTPANWAIAISNGSQVPVVFGAQYDTTTVASVATTASTSDVTGDTTSDMTEDTGETGGLMSRLGSIALGAAVVLVILAGVGVVLLRKS